MRKFVLIGGSNAGEVVEIPEPAPSFWKMIVRDDLIDHPIVNDESTGITPYSLKEELYRLVNFSGYEIYVSVDLETPQKVIEELLKGYSNG